MPSVAATVNEREIHMVGSQWRPMDTTNRILTAILVLAALAFAAFKYQSDPEALNRRDGIDQAKVDPRPAISSTIDHMLGTDVTPTSSK
jgi:hypothetical protein